jgi:endonuclease-8
MLRDREAPMPEGDTLERIARRMAPMRDHVPQIATPHPRTAPLGLARRLAGATLLTVEARGKHLLLGFSNGLTLHSHLRMSGRWEVGEAGAPPRRRTAPAWIELTTDTTTARLFNGPILELLTPAQIGLHPALRRLGGDVLEDTFAVDEAVGRARAGAPERTLADILLDQTVLAGVGNVWKSEALFDRGLDPWTPVGAVDDATLADLLSRTSHLMRAHVASGAPRRPTRIYGRARRACPLCGTAIRSRTQGDEGRVTYWCPSCQGPGR